MAPMNHVHPVVSVGRPMRSVHSSVADAHNCLNGGARREQPPDLVLRLPTQCWAPARGSPPTAKQERRIRATGPYLGSRSDGSLVKSVPAIADKAASDKATAAELETTAQFFATPHAGAHGNTPVRLAVDPGIAQLRLICGN